MDSGKYMNNINGLGDSSMELLENLDIENEQKNKIAQLINSEYENLLGKIRPDDIKFSIVNFGNRNTPELMLFMKDMEIGTITAKDQVIFNRNEAFLDELEVRNEILTELKNNEPAFDMEASTAKQAETLMENSIPLPQEDITKNAMDSINKTIEAQGVDNPFTKNQEKIISAVEKEKRKNNSLISTLKDRYAKQNDFKELKNEINSLYSDLEYELKVAELNGFNKQKSDRIEYICSNIADKTISAAKVKSSIPSLKEQTMEMIKDSRQNIAEKVQHGFNKIVAGLNMKINAGKNTLNMMKEEVEKANDRFSARIDTKYTGVSEKIEQLNRNWMSVNYNIDKTIAKNIDHIKDSISKIYDRTAEIKGAFQDLGRAVTGQERTGEKADLTPTQKNVISALETFSQNMKSDMTEMKKQYELSKEISAYSLSSVQEHRQSVRLDFSKTLDEACKNAMKRTIEGKTHEDKIAPDQSKMR